MEFSAEKLSSDEETTARENDIKKKMMRKEKKNKKSKKRKRANSDDDDCATARNTSGIVLEHNSDNQTSLDETTNSFRLSDETSQPPILVPAPAKSKSDFFAKLLAQEKSKPPVGTFHTVGKKASDMQTAEASKDWTCPKCSTSNYRHSHQCQKCKAIKRLTEWR